MCAQVGQLGRGRDRWKIDSEEEKRSWSEAQTSTGSSCGMASAPPEMTSNSGCSRKLWGTRSALVGFPFNPVIFLLDFGVADHSQSWAVVFWMTHTHTHVSFFRAFCMVPPVLPAGLEIVLIPSANQQTDLTTLRNATYSHFLFSRTFLRSCTSSYRRYHRFKATTKFGQSNLHLPKK